MIDAHFIKDYLALPQVQYLVEHWHLFLMLIGAFALLVFYKE